MFTHQITLTCACILASSWAAAACPTQQDMTTGIVTTTDDGQVEVHKTATKDMVQVDVRYNDGTDDGSVMQFAHGLFLRNVIAIEGGVLRVGQQEKYASDATLRLWEAPKPNASWSNEQPDGGIATSGPVTALRIGGCTYDSFEVTIGFADDPTYVEIYDYIPSLGIGLLTDTIESGNRERYRYVSIASQ